MDLNEIASFKFGISKTEYKNKISNKHYLEGKTQNSITYQDEFENKTAGVIAYFVTDGDQDKLARILVILNDFETDTQRKFIFTKIVSDLKKMYGEINYKDTTTINVPKEFRCSEMDIWKIENTIIMAGLSLSEHDCQDLGLYVAWGSSDNDPVSQQWNWIDSSKHEIK